MLVRLGVATVFVWLLGLVYIYTFRNNYVGIRNCYCLNKSICQRVDSVLSKLVQGKMSQTAIGNGTSQGLKVLEKGESNWSAEKPGRTVAVD